MTFSQLDPSPGDEIAWYREYLHRQGFPFFVVTQPGHSYGRTDEIRAWLSERDPEPASKRGWSLRYSRAGVYCVGFRDGLLATEFKIRFG